MGRFLIFLCLLLTLTGCDPYQDPLRTKDIQHEILIFSGITMADAVFELADIFQQNNSCRVSVMYGASGYLETIVDINRKGDIFFPGNISYMEPLKAEHVITRLVDVGYNQLSFFVAKGNPLGFDGSLEQLTDKKHMVMIGSAEAGSVGQETRELLEKHGIYEKVLQSAYSFAADSKGLASAIKDKEADIVINWLAAGMTKKNSQYMTPIMIDSPYLRKVPISMGLLKYSVDIACANRFLDLVASDTGRKIFAKYGFTQ